LGLGSIGEKQMKKEYTAVIKKEDDWWIGWIEEVPGVNCQERSLEELRETLRLTLQEALEFNRQEALAAAGAEFREEKIAV
jgi:predicted RNase H-like HicB family nuclease